MGNWFCELAII